MFYIYAVDMVATSCLEYWAFEMKPVQLRKGLFIDLHMSSHMENPKDRGAW